MMRPPALGPGSRVALVAPAGPLPEGAVDRALRLVEELGWIPLAGEHCRSRSGYLAGSDTQRAADLNAALRSPDNDAIWCLRGGYGTMRILPDLDWEALADRPRALIGFSDNTALHLAARRAGIVSFHGPHPGTPGFPGFSRESLLRVVARAAPAGALPFLEGAPPAVPLSPGAAEGRLVGGNLALLAALAGTPWAPSADGGLLFIEDVGEPPYRVDRMLSQLLLSGALDGVAGVIVGAFTEGGDGPPAEAVIAERLSPLRVPMAAGFPFGHVEASWTVPLGVLARLDATAGTLELLEPAVDPS